MKTRRWSKVGRDGSKVVLRLNDKRVPEGHEGCFLRQVNGKLVKSRLFDIGPKSWRKITKVEKDHAFNNYIWRKFHWNADDEDTIKKYVIKDLGKKWREDRQTLWVKLCDPTEQKEHNYKQKPKKVDAAKWQTFVDHRMSKYMKKISALNKANRAKQKIYHTSSSKSILAKGKELEEELGRPPTRGELFRETHQRTGRSGPDKYPNEETREAVETVERFMEDPTTHNHISTFDAVGRAFNEKEYHGRVRGLGFVPTPSQVFGSTSSSQRPASQSSIHTDPGFRLFTDGVLSVLNQIVSSSQLPSNVLADVTRLTQMFGGGVQSSQHSHGDTPPSDTPQSAQGDQQSEARRPETTGSPIVDVTGINSSGAGSGNQPGGASHSSSWPTGSADDNVLSSTSSDSSDSDSDSE
ncbi:hypothetical protein LINPERPRIM_LOCUS31459 [Linum perenne]